MIVKLIQKNRLDVKLKLSNSLNIYLLGIFQEKVLLK